VGGLRPGPGGESPGLAPSAARRKLPGKAVTTVLHPEGGWAAAGRATDLRYNIDRGTCVVNSGFGTNNKYTVVRTHYVSAHDPETHTPDQVTPVITRALDLMSKQGRTVNAASEATPDEPLPVDHLANIHQVLRGERRVRTQVVLTRLAELNPVAYEGWSYSDLKTALADEGIEIGKSHGHSVVRANDVTHALTDRDETTTERVTTGGSRRGSTRPPGKIPHHFPGAPSPPEQQQHRRGK
jgi:S-DNA-T family DNA segregation ATPase FtsK/SpoIIIE